MLNWNGVRHLEYAVPSVLATTYPDFELVVIDNASTDDSLPFLADRFPSVRVIRNPVNIGWAAGNNAGLQDALARGIDWIVLLNNDVLVDPRWLVESLPALNADPQIGIAGFLVFGEYRRTPHDAFFAAQREYRSLEIHPAAVVAGCAMMIRRSVIDRIGFFDETFVMYGEEEDYERRAAEAGYRVVSTNVPVWHNSEGSSRSVPYRSAFLAQRNLMRLAVKYDGLLSAARIAASIFRFGCAPFRSIDPDDSLQRRLRPSHPVVNLALTTSAVLWNVVNYRATRQVRRRERARLRSAVESPAGQS